MELTMMKGGTSHHNTIAIYNKRIRSYEIGWWRREVVLKGSGDDGKWWWREVVMKGSGDDGKWWWRGVVRKGGGDDGRWWRWEVVTMGSGDEGKWWWREVVIKGSGEDVWNLVFCCVKWLQSAMKGTLCVRRVWLGLFDFFYIFCNKGCL